jgi:transcription-repair coupling factor (superfamily II helicase)
MTGPLQTILHAAEPMTLSGVPSGFLPWLAADLTRAAHGSGGGARAVVIAADEGAMRALADTVHLFAPEVQVLTLPAWDCLPYDRSSPALRVMAVEEAADQKIGLPRAAMGRAPMQALQIVVGKHRRHLGSGARRGKSGLSRRDLGARTAACARKSSIHCSPKWRR